MMSEKQNFKRNNIINEITNIVRKLAKDDENMEALTIRILFRKSSFNRSIFFNRSISSFLNISSLKYILNEVFEATSLNAKKDKTLDWIQLDIKKAINSNRIGRVLIIDLTNNIKENEKHKV